MPIFQRIGPPILDHNGDTIDTDIRLSNSSHLEIIGGNRGKHFKLKFATDDGTGWWVDRRALDELITELLYIRREIVEHWGEDNEPVLAVDPRERPVEAMPQEEAMRALDDLA